MGNRRVGPPARRVREDHQRSRQSHQQLSEKPDESARGFAFEALTLHKRFPFAVVVGLFFLDEGAADDATASRKSTFQNAHAAFRIFTNRESPAGRDEQFERLYIVLFGPEGDGTKLRFYLAGDTSEERDVDSVFDDMLLLLEERNPDFYEGKDGSLRKRG